MKPRAPLIRVVWIRVAWCACFLAITSSATLSQTSAERETPEGRAARQLQLEFFSDFNVAGSAAAADQLLDRYPGDISALFIRMETAALQQQTDSVLDSALRLCTMPAPADIQEIASSRILENAGNSRAFDDVLQRVGLAMEEGNACTFNLRLALVASAADGARRLDLDKTADSAGLLTHWRIAGPFGRFSYLDFGRGWPAETNRFWDTGKSGVEFWFRDGMVPLPEYFPSSGVLYAASNVRIGNRGASQLDVLSPGPYSIFVDGRRVLTKDSRYAIGGNRESLMVRLQPGRHRIVVKFTADAAPFSVDLHPVFMPRSAEAPSPPLSPSFRAYIGALLAYFRGDLNQVEQIASSVPNQDCRPLLYIRALLWSGVDDHSSRAGAAWESLKKIQPAAMLARIRAAEFALRNGSTLGLQAEVEYLLKHRPDSEAVNELYLRLPEEDSSATAQAFARLVALHPSCSHLSEALKFYNSQGDQAAAQSTEDQLARCAPESLDYARVLAESGRHKEAAMILQQKLAHNPLSRNTSRMLVEQLVLSNAMNQAKLQAERLRRLAPGNRFYATVAADPLKVLDSNSARANGFVSGDEFYAKYRLNGLELARGSMSNKGMEGQGTVILLDEHVLKIQADGTASLYSHRVVRLLNRQAIRQYGQITLPSGAEILELRTIKCDGRVMEPELTNQKPAISMPALDPGDSVDEEFVIQYPDWQVLPAGSLLFEFGSAETPVMRSRLVLIAPAAADIHVEQRNGMPEPAATELSGDELVRRWEMDYLPALAREPFSPRGMLPAIDIAAGKSIERLREALIESTRIGPHVMEAVLSQNGSNKVSEREKARRLYQFVTGRIESTGPDFADYPAEDSLATGEGSRTAVLLAMARAMGIKAALLLSRKFDRECAPNSDCYNQPMVRFRVDGEIIDVDPEADNLAFGALSSELDPRNALLLAPTTGEVRGPDLVSLSMNPAQEQSVGEGDLFLDRSGNLTVSIRVRLGATRAQQIRTLLRSGGNNELQRLLEQLAARIFPGAINVHGRAIHPADLEEALEITLHCEIPQFMSMQSGRREIGQLAPPLGLRFPLASGGMRRSPLILDSVLAESSVFHLHLPTGVSADALPRNFEINSEFGSYALTYSQMKGQIDVTRKFAVPVQVVEPGRFTALRDFAQQIEQAEREQIILKIKDARSEGNLPSNVAAE